MMMRFQYEINVKLNKLVMLAPSSVGKMLEGDSLSLARQNVVHIKLYGFIELTKYILKICRKIESNFTAYKYFFCIA